MIRKPEAECIGSSCGRRRSIKIRLQATLRPPPIAASHKDTEVHLEALNGYDDIVVGTGPGGATVARELALAGRRVLMIERGPRFTDTGFVKVSRAVYRDEHGRSDRSSGGVLIGRGRTRAVARISPWAMPSRRPPAGWLNGESICFPISLKPGLTSA